MTKPVLTKRLPLLIVALLVGVVLLAATSLAEPLPDEVVVPEPFPFSDRYPAEVLLNSSSDLAILVSLDIDVGNMLPVEGALPGAGDTFEPLVATVYINDREVQLLAHAGLTATPIPNESMRAFREYGPGTTGPEAWPTFEEFVMRMEDIATDNPNLVRMESIGQSVQGREIWVLKITDNPDVEEDEPEFKYTSTMHGNEGVGTELTIRLAELLTSSYGSDPDLTALVDEMEIWLCPIHNPDGYVAGTRYNAHGVDLNRDFPDRITDPYDDPTGREPETQAMMYFGYDHRFVMGANYHTGALVVNVPWDSVPSTPDLAPDDAIFMNYGIGYAIRNPDIWNGPFEDGVTRGWAWYIIRGGMQDWAYHWQGEHHVTIEVSSLMPPPYNQMDTYWDHNDDAMLWWMERALMGVRGRVYDAATGAPLDAIVDVVEIGKPVYTDPDVGDYHRLLLTGTYTITCSAAGYQDQFWTVDVVEGPATVQDCAMLPPPYAVAAGDSEAAGEPGTTVTHTFSITNVGTVSDTYDLALVEGAWPAALLDGQIGPLEPDEGGQARVTVDIPAQTAADFLFATDVLTLSVTSVADPGIGTLANGTTLAAADLSLELVVDDFTRSDLPGQAVTYTLTITNNGSYTDTYSLSLSGNAWPSSVIPAQTQALAPGQGATALVRVEIPGEPGSPTDTVVARATSGWDPSLYAEQSLSTLAMTDLAVILTVDDASLLGLAGQAVTYTLTVSNAGAYTDTYALALATNAWPTTVVPTQTGPLAPGDAAGVMVRVDIPVAGTMAEDTVIVRATSGWDDGVYAEQALVTTRLWRVYLPLTLTD